MRRAYLVRSQEAVILAVFMTLASDLVAMGRHTFMWVDAASRNKLIALVAGMAVVTAAMGKMRPELPKKPDQHGCNAAHQVSDKLGTMVGADKLADYRSRLAESASSASF
jgi:hypothetical protein